MGSITSKCCPSFSNKYNEKNKQLKAKIQVLEEELKEFKRLRELESRVYEQNVMVFSAKEEEWQADKKKHNNEVVALRKRLQEADERIKCLEEEILSSRGDKELRRFGADYLVQHMKEEQARREEAVEKWKQLYLAIKTELDDLIQKTKQGEKFYWGADQGFIQRLQHELKAKEENMDILRSRIAVMEKEGAKRDREIDILRQSLKILSSSKRNRFRKNLSRGFRT